MSENGFINEEDYRHLVYGMVTKDREYILSERHDARDALREALKLKREYFEMNIKKNVPVFRWTFHHFDHPSREQQARPGAGLVDTTRNNKRVQLLGSMEKNGRKLLCVRDPDGSNESFRDARVFRVP